MKRRRFTRETRDAIAFLMGVTMCALAGDEMDHYFAGYFIGEPSYPLTDAQREAARAEAQEAIAVAHRYLYPDLDPAEVAHA